MGKGVGRRWSNGLDNKAVVALQVSCIFVLRVEMVNEAIEDGGDEVAHFTPIWQLTLVVFLSHVVHQAVLIAKALRADATP